MDDVLSAKLDEMLAGLEGVTPGPWSRCESGCECVSVHSSEHPIAMVTKGDWGDDYPSLRFKEGGEGHIGATSVEAYMAQITYGTVSTEMAMANRAHIARCDPDTMRQIITLAQHALASQPITAEPGVTDEMLFAAQSYAEANSIEIAPEEISELLACALNATQEGK